MPVLFLQFHQQFYFFFKCLQTRVKTSWWRRVRFVVHAVHYYGMHGWMRGVFMAALDPVGSSVSVLHCCTDGFSDLTEVISCSNVLQQIPLRLVSPHLWRRTCRPPINSCLRTSTGSVGLLASKRSPHVQPPPPPSPQGMLFILRSIRWWLLPSRFSSAWGRVYTVNVYIVSALQT